MHARFLSETEPCSHVAGETTQDWLLSGQEVTKSLLSVLTCAVLSNSPLMNFIHLPIGRDEARRDRSTFKVLHFGVRCRSKSPLEANAFQQIGVLRDMVSYPVVERLGELLRRVCGYRHILLTFITVNAAPYRSANETTKGAACSCPERTRSATGSCRAAKIATDSEVICEREVEPDHDSGHRNHTA